MEGLERQTAFGATPLSDEEKHGLIPYYISTHSELNILEQNNIQSAILWAAKQKNVDPLNATFIFKFHQKMFGKVWKWAGKARTSEKNIGVEKHRLQEELGKLIGNVRFWIAHQTFHVDEVAVRFHHGLILIHLFPNGNGRHARLITDSFLEYCRLPPFSWGKRLIRVI